MKKKILMMAIMCLMAASSHAQVYAGDTWVQFPTRDLYDSQTMNMALQHAEMAARIAARRQALFEQYEEQAYHAFQNDQWSHVIYYVNQALDTKYYNGSVYYMRGYAYEQLGNFKQAKKDYRKAKKNGSYQAESALEDLKERMKKK